MMHFNNTLTIKKSKTNKQVINIIFSYFFSFIIFACIILLVSNPQKYTSSITSGFLLFANAVFPGLFPFLVLTKILSSLGAIDKIANKLSKLTSRFFKVSGIASYVFLISSLCGYPMGAKTTEDLLSSGKITNEEAPYIFMLSSVSGPMFIIGAIGSGMLKNTKAGLIVYMAHIIAGLICGFIFCNNKKRKNILKNVKNIQKTDINANFCSLLGNSVYSGIQTILVVGAYITIFFMLIDMLIGTKILTPITFIITKLFSVFGINGTFAAGVASGLVEITRGASEIAKIEINAISVSLICAIISFGGFSIIAQSLALGKQAKPKPHIFVFYKFCHAIISFFICLALFKIAK